MVIQDAFPAGLGRWLNANSLRFVALSPYHVFSRLTRNFP
jgi:hypothetical protein